MWGGVRMSWEEGLKLLENSNIDIDPHFLLFCDFCESLDFPIIVLSGGLKEIIEWMFQRNGIDAKARKIELISNSVNIINNAWEVIWVDEQGHDKGSSITKVRARERERLLNQNQSLQNKEDLIKTVFIGDGVSDISAAKSADYLFAKKGHNLEKWCLNEGVKYYAFESFEDVKKGLIDILKIEGFQIPL